MTGPAWRGATHRPARGRSAGSPKRWQPSSPHAAGAAGPHVLVGHSFGSLVVRAYARAVDPEKVVAVRPGGRSPTDWLTGKPSVESVARYTSIPPEVHPMVMSHWCQPKCFTAMADYIGAFLRDKSLIGRHDSSTPHSGRCHFRREPAARNAHVAAATRRVSAGGRHIVARGSAHWVQFDEPDLIVGIVRELVEGVR